jgi:hypothetical protein
MVLHPESQGSAALHPGLCYFALAGLNGAAHFTGPITTNIAYGPVTQNV